MYCQRFDRPVQVTQHARRRMAERSIAEGLLFDLIESGEVRHKDNPRIWVAKHYPDRTDNLICIAPLLEASVVIKTVMHHFSWEAAE